MEAQNQTSDIQNGQQQVLLTEQDKNHATKRDYVKVILLILLLLYEVAFLWWIQSEYYNNFLSQFYQ
jgi:hypothetical protein